MHHSVSLLLSRSSKQVLLRRLARQRRDGSTLLATAFRTNSTIRRTATTTTRGTSLSAELQWNASANNYSQYHRAFSTVLAPHSNHDDDDDDELSLDDEIEALAASCIPLDEYGDGDYEDLRALRQQRLRMEHSSLDLELGETSVWDHSQQEEDDHGRVNAALQDELIEEENDDPFAFPEYPAGSPAAELQRRKRTQTNGSARNNSRKHQPVLSPLDLLEQLSLDPSQSSTTQTQATQQQQTLDPLSYVGPQVEESEEEITTTATGDLSKLQLRLECEAQREAVEKYQRLTDQARSRKDFASLSSLQKLILKWYQPVRDEIEATQRSYIFRSIQRKNKKTKKENNMGGLDPAMHRYGPKLNTVEPEKLAIIATHEALTLCITKTNETHNYSGGCSVVAMALKLGQAVEEEVLLQRILKQSMEEERAKKTEKEGESANAEVAAFAKETLQKPKSLNASSKEEESAAKPWSYAESRLNSYLQEIAGDKAKGKNRRSVAYAVMTARRALNAEEWTKEDQVHIGSILLKILLQHATIRLPDGTVQPAFRMEKRWHGGGKGRYNPRFKTTNFIKVHDALWKLALADEFESIAATTTRHKPMVIPPVPWTSPNHGGYAWLKTDLIRFHGSQMQREALDEADLTKVFDGLNALSREAWVINKTILKVADECWEENIPLGDIPSRTDLEVPPEPSAPAKTKFVSEDDADYDEASVAAQKKQWSTEFKSFLESRNRYRRVLQKNRDLFSLRCSARLKLGQAKQFQDYEQIYFPYNMDFRGRAYPVPPHLSNVGSDLCRGMLKFAKAKPLGKRGLYWLQVHLANLAGKDKMTFDDRAQYTIDNLENVKNAVKDPFGRKSGLADDERPWWMGLDDPFQGLATCHEIINAIDSGDPETYECSLPVHMDGSCNGLQHYAAIGLDPVGGKAVNLCEEDIPQDVYLGVMDEVIERVAKEAARDLDLDKDEDKLSKQDRKALLRNRSAKLVDGLIDRGVVKRTVMTSVYGVTYIGARQQIQEKIEEKLEELGRDLDEMDWAVFGASGYLAEVTMNVIGDLFTGAKGTMNWLTQCARLLSSKGYPVAWMTPLGLPALQPYRQKHSSRIVTALTSMTVADYSDDLPIHKSRSVSAFPPNYIHSLDSTHMLMTALEMDRRGLSFSAVHDSFWTHPCDIDEMNEALREQFVELYSLPLLEELKQSFELRYPDIKFPDLPPKGGLDLADVKKAKFFFQ